MHTQPQRWTYPCSSAELVRVAILKSVPAFRMRIKLFIPCDGHRCSHRRLGILRKKDTPSICLSLVPSLEWNEETTRWEKEKESIKTVRPPVELLLLQFLTFFIPKIRRVAQALFATMKVSQRELYCIPDSQDTDAAGCYFRTLMGNRYRGLRTQQCGDCATHPPQRSSPHHPPPLGRTATRSRPSGVSSVRYGRIPFGNVGPH